MSSKNKQKETAVTRGSASVDEDGNGGGGNGGGTGHKSPRDFATDGKGGSGINRVNRACSHCRRMKMRCVGADDPPCKRCRVTGETCVMEKPRKGTSSLEFGNAAGQGDDRIKHLEYQVTSIQSTLADLVTAIKSTSMVQAQPHYSTQATSSSSRARSTGSHSHPTPVNVQAAGMGNGSPGTNQSGAGAGVFYPSPNEMGGGGRVASVSGGGGYDDSIQGIHHQGGVGPTGIHPGLTMNAFASPSGLASSSTGTATRPDSLARLNTYGSSSTINAGAHHSNTNIPGLADFRSSFDTSNTRGTMGIPAGGTGGSSFSHTQSGFSPQGGQTGAGGRSASISSTLDPRLTHTETGQKVAGGIGGGAGAGGPGGQPAQMWDEGGFAIPTNRTSGGYDYIDPVLQASGWDYPFDEPTSGVLRLDGQEKGEIGSNPSSLQPVNQALALVKSKRDQLKSSTHTSTNASPSNSDGEEEDALGSNMILAPLANMSSMAGLAEAAVERARAERLGEKPVGSITEERSTDAAGKADSEAQSGDRGKGAKRPNEGDESGTTDGKGHETEPGNKEESRPGKKRKVEKPDDTVFIVPKDPIERAVAALNPPGIIVESHRSGKGKKTRKHVHAFPDVVALGIVPEDEARYLFDLYFSGSHAFLPIYDPSYDTWDSLRLRSPFSISAIIAVGARVRDGGGTVSEVQRASTEHARKIGLGTMWTPVARIEAVQAMLVLAAFSQNGWLPSGHAVRLGLDMEINHSFMKLLRGRMGAGKNPTQLEEERDLVIQARCWFTLYMIEHQMSYGTGRPAILREDASIAECRRFLDHPLSIATDVRLISTVEMIALRAPLHIVLTTSPEEPVNQATVVRLQQANRDFDRWLAFWERVMIERYGKSRNDFFMESLLSQRSYASLFINSQLLRGIKDAADVKKMPPDKRELAIKAMRNAQNCLEIAIRGENYRAGLKYAVHYTHVSAAFAASFLIRIARLFPQELNLRKTAKDVEELASVLEQVPAGRYARSLRLLLRRARKSRYLPPPSMPGSPNKHHAQLSNARTPVNPQSPWVGLGSAEMHTTMVQTSSMGPNGLRGMAPMLTQTSPMMSMTTISGKNESPNSNPESYEFDASFMQDLVNRAGLSFGNDQNLPLFLNGESLGETTDNVNTAMGLEGFFLPPDIDMRFIDLNAFTASNASQLGEFSADHDLPPDTWW